ncbi:MAG: hypothetical protein HYZ14_12305 [Bacteroidetes bacterium]|nr:hypothetical protein [Bacteroidota bacterium]
MLLTACKTSENLQYATIYHGYSKEGLHGRAVTFVNQDAVIVAGPRGVFCGKYFGGELIEQPALQGAADIRDIHLFNNGTIALLSSGDTAKLYVLGFNGEQATVFDSAGVFLDGFDFWDEQNGIAYGDPVNDKFFLVKTTDAGRSWKAFTPEIFPSVLEKEAGFAASGTGIQCLGDSTVYFATGMADTARLFCSYDQGKTWVTKNTPLKSGDSYGIYSIYFWSETEGMIIGGSWEQTTYKKQICYYTADGGNTWINRSKGLGGYSSCINGNENGTCLFATGDQGTYFTLDKGLHWHLLFERNYYSIAINQDFVAFAGRDGVLEVLRYKF